MQIVKTRAFSTKARAPSATDGGIITATKLQELNPVYPVRYVSNLA